MATTQELFNNVVSGKQSINDPAVQSAYSQTPTNAFTVGRFAHSDDYFASLPRPTRTTSDLSTIQRSTSGADIPSSYRPSGVSTGTAGSTVPGATGYSPSYQPMVSPTGEVMPFSPADFGFITPESVNQFNSTLSTYSQPTNLAPGQAFPSASQSGGVTQPVGGAPVGTSPTTGYSTSGTPTGGITGFESLPQQGSFLGGVDVKGEAGAPGFSFNFAQEQATAYNQLQPFYQKLVEFAKGDINLAKRILEYTYQIGMRESKQEYDFERRKQSIEFPQEQEQMKTQQNQRGILTSGFGQTEQGRMLESQSIRKEAMDRAKENRESRLSSSRGFGLEKEQRGFQRGLFDTERERRNESMDMTMNKYNIKQSEYSAKLQQYALKKQAEAGG